MRKVRKRGRGGNGRVKRGGGVQMLRVVFLLHRGDPREIPALVQLSEG
jgi:hypothetical protein